MSDPDNDPSLAWDELYREREHLVAHLAAIYPSVMVPATVDQWAIVYIVLPGNRQFSRHIAAENLDLFTHVTTTTQRGETIWDGHTHAEGYKRLQFATDEMAVAFGHPSWKEK